MIQTLSHYYGVPKGSKLFSPPGDFLIFFPGRRLKSFHPPEISVENSSPLIWEDIKLRDGGHLQRYTLVSTANKFTVTLEVRFMK